MRTKITKTFAFLALKKAFVIVAIILFQSAVNGQTPENPASHAAPTSVAGSPGPDAGASSSSPAAAVPNSPTLKTEVPDKRDKLDEGFRLEHEWRLDEAAKAYRDAMQSKSADIASQATARYNQSRNQMNTPAWVLSRVIWPIAWRHRYFDHQLFFFLLTILYVVGVALVLTGTLGRFLWNRFMTRAVTLGTPVKIGDSDLTGTFMAEIQAATTEMSKQRLRAEGVRHQSGGSSALTAPSSAFADVASSLPSVKGINVGQFLTALIKILQFFFWRFETAVGKDENTRVVAYGTLRWAWWSFYSWRVEGKDAGEAARMMAYLVLGVSYRPDPIWRWLERRSGGLFRNRPSEFASAQSFMKFAAGLRALQLYQEQRKASYLDEAEDQLHDCIAMAPGDRLPRYYMGVVRIEQAVLLRQSPDAQFARERVLNEATAQLGEVAGDLAHNPFHYSSLYNQAVASLYRITPGGYQDARAILNTLAHQLKIPPTSWRVRIRRNLRGSSGAGDVSQHDTIWALRLQVHSLQLLSQVRPLWDHLIPFEPVDVVVARVERFGMTVDRSFKLDQISRRARNDLRSDYNYLLGHTERGRAQPFADTEAAETALAAAERRKGAKQVHLDAAAHAREQKEMHLLRAVVHFQNALVYHPYWVPALLNLKQIYGQLGSPRENDLKRINAVLPEWHPREEATEPAKIA